MIALMEEPNPLRRPLNKLKTAAKYYLKYQQELWDLEQAKAPIKEIRSKEAQIEMAELKLMKALKEAP